MLQKATLMEQEPTAAVPSLAPMDDLEKDVGLVAPAGSALAFPPAHALLTPARRASHLPPASHRAGAGMAPLCPSNVLFACLVCLPVLRVGEAMHFLPDLGVYRAT